MTMLCIIVTFALMYNRLDICKSVELNDIGFSAKSNFIYAIYFSTITFFTIGYGDISPWNSLVAIISGIQGFCGVFLMSYLVVTFVRKIIR